MTFVNSATNEVIEADENPDPDLYYRVVANTSQANQAFEDGESPLIVDPAKVDGLTPDDWQQLQYEQYQQPGSVLKHAPETTLEPSPEPAVPTLGPSVPSDIQESTGAPELTLRQGSLSDAVPAVGPGQLPNSRFGSLASGLAEPKVETPSAPATPAESPLSAVRGAVNRMPGAGRLVRLPPSLAIRVQQLLDQRKSQIQPGPSVAEPPPTA